ncbi:deoxycytidylate deaminase [Pseudomonas palleroniana]|uniref:Deoxycytidylate deaminase n=1 Tax=Pseudomonas palleroniana TaxID=191390 RepID=A0A2L1JDW4_9PSED|nr:anti-phage dCTP deaminase [Pseudomonas palleroniana]AVE06616.1 deoxycytidylate deaminase [Pseudomonas palleroniana]
MVSHNRVVVSSLFKERSKFVVIGLTGRTGSGCTTAANILESSNPNFPDLNAVQYKGKPFFERLNGRRYEILKNYAERNIVQFYSIKVSDLISAYLLSMESQELFLFIMGTLEAPIDSTKLLDILENGSYGKNKIKAKFAPIMSKLLDHEEKFVLLDKEKEKFISFLRLMRKFTNDFKSDLQKIDNALYVSIYQSAGNSIRKIGCIDKGYKSVDFMPASVFHLPETINRVVKGIRSIKDKALIVVDAIRNPYEARFFKDRYSAFYLVSINAPDDDRAAYLHSVHKFTSDKLREIDDHESGKTKITHADFISQNVKQCIEISDIHLFNPRGELDNNNVLKAQLAWYVALMLHPGLVSPTSMERVMQIAYSAKSNSGCVSRQVGAVVTDADFSIKSVGWNDVAKGQVPCSLRSLKGLMNDFDTVAYSKYERTNSEFRLSAGKKLIKLADALESSGQNLSYCFKDIRNGLESSERTRGNQVHTRSLHAEENAFLQIVKYGGVAIEGGKLFTTASPCELCAKKAYQLGLKEIVFIDPYPGIANDHILEVGGNPPELLQFYGAVGKGYHQLYDSVLPYKDELAYME